MARGQDLVQGTLDMLILKALSLGPLHGYGTLLRIQQFSGDVLQVHQGSLYPALYRLEKQGLITSEWGESENRRRAKFYQLTPTGRARLRSEREQWERMVAAIAGVLNATRREAGT
jgi:transcriptional regulator